MNEKNGNKVKEKHRRYMHTNARLHTSEENKNTSETMEKMSNTRTCYLQTHAHQPIQNTEKP